MTPILFPSRFQGVADPLRHCLQPSLYRQANLAHSKQGRLVQGEDQARRFALLLP